MITVQQIAAICKVKPRTVIMWIREGRLVSDSESVVPTGQVYVFLNKHGLTNEARILNILFGE